METTEGTRGMLGKAPLGTEVVAVVGKIGKTGTEGTITGASLLALFEDSMGSSSRGRFCGESLCLGDQENVSLPTYLVGELEPVASKGVRTA